MNTKKAADQGMAFAMSNLAWNFENGSGVREGSWQSADVLPTGHGAWQHLPLTRQPGFLLSQTDDAAHSKAQVAALYRKAAEWGAPWGRTIMASYFAKESASNDEGQGRSLVSTRNSAGKSVRALEACKRL
ncbi:hypothetical protein [Dokdonella sp.]|uniref:hypothetical protein n=1 Tax=Dokdonella sp. TaxID=2291710 RepID=UPI0035297ABC